MKLCYLKLFFDLCASSLKALKNTPTKKCILILTRAGGLRIERSKNRLEVRDQAVKSAGKTKLKFLRGSQ